MPKKPATTSSGQCDRPSGARTARAMPSISRPASAKRIAESSNGGTDATPSFPNVQLPLQQSATVTNAAMVRTRLRDAHPSLVHRPHAPERAGVGQRIAMDEHEVRGHALLDAPGVVDAVQRAAVAGRGRERLERLEARADEQLDLPREMTRAHRSPTEVRTRRDAHAGAARGRDRVVRHLFALGHALLELG